MGRVLLDADATWANSAAAGTVVNLDLTQERATPGEQHVVVVRNPSGVTALTVALFGTEEIDGVDVQVEHVAAGDASPLTLAVPAGAARQFVVDAGWIASGAGRLALSNDTALGAADGFTADVKVREVG